MNDAPESVGESALSPDIPAEPEPTPELPPEVPEPEIPTTETPLVESPALETPIIETPAEGVVVTDVAPVSSEEPPVSSGGTPTPTPAPSPTPPPPPVPPAQTPIATRLAEALEAIRFRKRARLDKILQLAAKKGKIKNDDVEKLLRVSDSTAQRYLNQLVIQAKLRRVGHAKQPHYEPL